MPPSTLLTEFIILVATSYDYRLLSPRREEILDVIKRLYIAGMNRDIPIYHLTTKNLKDFTTTENEMKKGVNRHPSITLRVTSEDILLNIYLERQRQMTFLKDP